MDRIYIFHPAQTKNRQYLLTVRPFQFGLSFLFYLCIIFLCKGLCPARHRLCPDRRQDIFLLHCLNNESHYLPFLPLRHNVANFFPACIINLHCIKIYFTTQCRKLFPCMFHKSALHKNLLYDIVSQTFSIMFQNPYEIHFMTPCRKVPTRPQNYVFAWNLLCDIVSQSSSLTYSKMNNFPVYTSCRSSSAGSVVPSAVSSPPSTSYKSNSSFILIFN